MTAVRLQNRPSQTRSDGRTDPNAELLAGADRLRRPLGVESVGGRVTMRVFVVQHQHDLDGCDEVTKGHSTNGVC
jgi:hypothetical protein